MCLFARKKNHFANSYSAGDFRLLEINPRAFSYATNKTNRDFWYELSPPYIYVYRCVYPLLSSTLISTETVLRYFSRYDPSRKGPRTVVKVEGLMECGHSSPAGWK